MSRTRLCAPPSTGNRQPSLKPLHQFTHFFDDDLFDRRAERSRLSVWDHCASTLVAALLQHSQRRNIGEDVIRISRHPGIIPTVLSAKPQRIIDHYFAPEHD